MNHEPAMWRRPLGDMLAEVSAAAFAGSPARLPVKATSLELALPVEIEFRLADGEIMFVADVPVWRWRTVFDQTPSQLRITWGESIR